MDWTGMERIGQCALTAALLFVIIVVAVMDTYHPDDDDDHRGYCTQCTIVM